MIDPIAPAATPRPGPATAGASSNRMLTSDFETFLRMLTVQMQNQDPLNPMEASDFAVQLATFSGVEQAVRTNQLLESMLAQTAMGELAGLVGMTVRAPGPARFDGSGVTLSLPSLPEAEAARLMVRDEMGAVVDTAEVPAAGGTHVWRGLGGDGMPLPPGSYRFEVTALRDGQPDGTAQPVERYAEVIEARRDGGATVLVLRGGHEVGLDSVTALRAATP